MSDHIPDVTKMIGETPRTDAELVEMTTGHGPVVTKTTWVHSSLCFQLERELNAANERIKRLEEAGDAMETRLHLRKNISDQFVYKGDAESVENWNKSKEDKL